MGRDFEIRTGNDNRLYQTFKGKVYKLYKGERYFCFGKWKKGSDRMHRDVWEFYNGKIPKGFEIHHKDENTYNNKIENLELLSQEEHYEKHKDDFIKKVTSEEHKKHLEEIRELTKEWHASEDGIKWHREHAIKNNFGKPDLPIKKCKQCECDFKPKTYTQEFCSNKCKTKHRRLSGIDDIKKECIVCGCEFTGNKYSKTQTCGHKCGRELRRTSV